jgi:Icc-related predicted phosphoesterase
VRGNHDKQVEYHTSGECKGPAGGVDLHGRVVNYNGLLMAGVEGSLRYRDGPYQYTQTEMFGNVLRLVPGLLWNRLRYGRYLDLFVSHAPPMNIHDKEDLPHNGVIAFRWLLQVFQPTYHLHGHVHLYRPDAISDTKYGNTRILNSYAYRETTILLPAN